jgi:hypothetical protein
LNDDAQMSEKIAFLRGRVSIPALLASIAEREGLGAVVMVCRVNGCWDVCWADGLTSGGLSMAAIKLMSVVQDAIHGMPSSGSSPPEDDAA